MTKRNRWMISTLAGALVLALGLSGCGRRGALERPPAKDQSEETTDTQNLTQDATPVTPGSMLHASF